MIQFLSGYNAYFSVNRATNIPWIPADRLLIESDAYDNDTEIQIIEDASNAIANILGIEHDAFIEQIYQNFQRVISYVRPIE